MALPTTPAASISFSQIYSQFGLTSNTQRQLTSNLARYISGTAGSQLSMSSFSGVRSLMYILPGASPSNFPAGTGTTPTRSATFYSFSNASSHYLDFGAQAVAIGTKGLSAKFAIALRNYATWQRVFDFTSGSVSQIFFGFNGNSSNQFRFGYNGNVVVYDHTYSSGFTLGQIYYFGLVYDPNTGSNGTLKCWVNGASQSATISSAAKATDMTSTQVSGSWVGRSPYNDMFLDATIFNLQVWNNVLADSALSSYTTISTTAPTAATSITVGTITDTSIQISWTAPSSFSYTQISWTPAYSLPTILPTVASGSTQTYTASNLIAGTGYTFYIRSYNASHVSSTTLLSNASVYTTTDSASYGMGLFVMTTAGVTGSSGPTLAQCKSAYTNYAWTANSSYFGMTTTGIQEVVIPYSGTYTFIASGAAAGISPTANVVVGRGIVVTSRISLTKGQRIYVLVGHRGADASGSSVSAGGGGTFIAGALNSTPLLCAGGGGTNWGYYNVTTGYYNTWGTDGQTGTTGGGGPNANPGGSNGGAGSTGDSSGYPDSGAGFTGNSVNGANTGARSFTNGGAGLGGTIGGTTSAGGGFGGGGGGGGGYSGGAGNTFLGARADYGGGGSYDSANSGGSFAATRYTGVVTSNLDIWKMLGPGQTTGLYYTVYNQYYNDDLNFFTTATVLYSGTATSFSNLSNITGGQINDANQFVSTIIYGWFKAPVTGTYTWGMGSDDAGYLWLGSSARPGYCTTANAFIAQPGLRGFAISTATISLTAGIMYPIRMVTGNNGGPGGFTCYMQQPGSSTQEYNLGAYTVHNSKLLYSPSDINTNVGYNVDSGFVVMIAGTFRLQDVTTGNYLSLSGNIFTEVASGGTEFTIYNNAAATNNASGGVGIMDTTTGLFLQHANFVIYETKFGGGDHSWAFKRTGTTNVYTVYSQWNTSYYLDWNGSALVISTTARQWRVVSTTDALAANMVRVVSVA